MKVLSLIKFIRYLIMKKKYDEANKVFMKIAKTNKKKVLYLIISLKNFNFMNKKKTKIKMSMIQKLN